MFPTQKNLVILLQAKLKNRPVNATDRFFRNAFSRIENVFAVLNIGFEHFQRVQRSQQIK